MYMNEETMKVWVALLKEWVDESDYYDIIEYSIGFSFTYCGMIVDLKIDKVFEVLHAFVAQYDGTDVESFKLSEIDLLNPNTTPSERFQAIKYWLDVSFDLLDAYDRGIFN